MYRSPYKNTKLSLRIVGVDDGAFPTCKAVGDKTRLVAILFRDLTIAAVKVGQITVDGRDANRVLASMLRGLRFDVVMLSTISFGGFNLVDIKDLARSLRKPIIAISREKPDNLAVLRALRKHFADWRARWMMVRNAGRLYGFKPVPKEPTLYFEVKGASPAYARTSIASAATISRLPEPIRVAGIVARGLVD